MINALGMLVKMQEELYLAGPFIAHKIITIITPIFLISQGSQYIGHMHPDVTGSIITSSNVLWNKYLVHMMWPQTSCHYSLAMVILVYHDYIVQP